MVTPAGSAVTALRVNGSPHRIAADPATPLALVLRDLLGLTGTKLGCGGERCGACMVIADGEAVHSCATAIEAFAGKAVTTIEGLGTPEAMHPVQRAFVTARAAQCGYCIPGIIVSVAALLDRNPRPDERAVQAALAPHLCRCGAHPRILRAVRLAIAERAP